MREKLPDELVDELLAGAKTEEEIVGPSGLFSQLSKRLVERTIDVELMDHLGDEPHEEPPGGVGKTRSGVHAKTLTTEHPAGGDQDAKGSQGQLRAENREESASERLRL